MAVFRWGQSWSLGDLESEVDRLLQSVNLTFQGLRFGRQYPPINLYEMDDEFLLTAELPGVRTDEIELTIAGGVLTIRGGRPADELEHRYRRQERPCGMWKRSVNLPDRIIEESLRAELVNGILTIHLPKAPDDAPRRITVTGGE